MGHYTEIPVPFPVLSTFFFSGPRQFASGYLIRAGPVTSSLPISSYQAGKWLRTGLGIVGHYSEKLIWIHNVSYTLPKLFHNLSLTGSLYWILYHGFTGNDRGLSYILCLVPSSGHYIDVFIQFPSLYWPVISLFRPIRVTILENFRIVRGLILNSSAFPGNPFKIPLG